MTSGTNGVLHVPLLHKKNMIHDCTISTSPGVELGIYNLPKRGSNKSANPMIDDQPYDR
jgi:hypothetical protein